MKLLYGTGNPAKLAVMKTRLQKKQYFYDLPSDQLNQIIVEDGFLQFFKKVLNI